MPQRQTRSGSILEGTVKSILTGSGFTLVSYTEWKRNPEKYGEELLLTNVPYKTIYNHTGKTEFLVRSKKYNLETRIECKWQQVAGSVDEKLPYLYLNAIETMPENDIIVLIDGNGWKPGSITWLKTVVKNRKYLATEKNIRVLNLQEFITWANSYFR